MLYPKPPKPPWMIAAKSVPPEEHCFEPGSAVLLLEDSDKIIVVIGVRNRHNSEG